MEIVKIASIGIVTAFCILILKEHKSELALIVGIVGGALILISVIDYFVGIFAFLKEIADKSMIPSEIYTIIFKIVGIGYITDFSAGLIEDTGQKSLSEKVVLGGKLIIMMMSLPIIKLMFDTIVELIQ